MESGRGGIRSWAGGSLNLHNMEGTQALPTQPQSGQADQRLLGGELTLWSMANYYHLR